MERTIEVVACGKVTGYVTAEFQDFLICEYMSDYLTKDYFSDKVEFLTTTLSEINLTETSQDVHRNNWIGNVTLDYRTSMQIRREDQSEYRVHVSMTGLDLRYQFVFTDDIDVEVPLGYEHSYDQPELVMRPSVSPVLASDTELSLDVENIMTGDRDTIKLNAAHIGNVFCVNGKFTAEIL